MCPFGQHEITPFLGVQFVFVRKCNLCSAKLYVYLCFFFFFSFQVIV